MELLLIILAMGLVTYLPRFLPVLIMERWGLPKGAERWLKGIPYAALGALIFPGILFVDENRPLVGLIGGLVAALLAYLRLPILLVILGAIGAVMLLA